MSKKLLKTLFTPTILMLISILSVFSASANTTDEASTISIDKRMSTNDEQITEEVTEPEATIPTIKPSYITAPGEFHVESEEVVQETTISQPTMENIPNATHATGATSFIASEDNLATPEEATADSASSGVVHTSDSSMSVLILVGLSALCCVVIGIHKKNLTE